MGMLAVSAAQTWLPRMFMSFGMSKPEKMPIPWNMNRYTPAAEASYPMEVHTDGIQLDMV